jgi:hypothetical protein
MQKTKYKYLSMEKLKYIYLSSRNASGIDSVHLNNVLTARLAHIIGFKSVLFSPFSLFNPVFFDCLKPFSFNGAFTT